jgi:hypothetical protein
MRTQRAVFGEWLARGAGILPLQVIASSLFHHMVLLKNIFFSKNISIELFPLH